MAKSQLTKRAKKSARKVVTFRTWVAAAGNVVLTGDFTDWDKDRMHLSKGTNGEWTGTIELAPGEYQYRLLVDGEWRDDPEAQTRVPNEFGTLNCVLKVS